MRSIILHSSRLHCNRFKTTNVTLCCATLRYTVFAVPAVHYIQVPQGRLNGWMNEWMNEWSLMTSVFLDLPTCPTEYTTTMTLQQSECQYIELYVVYPTHYSISHDIARNYNHTDGRNPAPLDMVTIPLVTGLYTCWVVQDFFHQQYHTSRMTFRLILFCWSRCFQ